MTHGQMFCKFSLLRGLLNKIQCNVWLNSLIIHANWGDINPMSDIHRYASWGTYVLQTSTFQILVNSHLTEYAIFRISMFSIIISCYIQQSQHLLYMWDRTEYIEYCVQLSTSLVSSGLFHF